mgnify:FL=1
MKKVIFLCLVVILISGCSNNENQELCNKIDEIDVSSYTQAGNYDELSSILEKHYTTYCKDSNSKVCISLNDYLEATKSEINFKDCSSLESNWKSICESDNKLMVINKKINVTYKHEEMWTVCNN